MPVQPRDAPTDDSARQDRLAERDVPCGRARSHEQRRLTARQR
ncbi:hypothetical protein [Streptomyces sp. NPDC003077]